jgi:hypothetical protein
MIANGACRSHQGTKLERVPTSQTVHAHAQGEGPSEPPEGGAEAAAELVADALKASSERNLSAMLLLAPDSFGDDGDDVGGEARQPLGFYVDRQMAEFESLVSVDSFVRRCLLFGSPASSQVRKSPKTQNTLLLPGGHPRRPPPSRGSTRLLDMPLRPDRLSDLDGAPSAASMQLTSCESSPARLGLV